MRKKSKPKKETFLSLLGPGLITGAADDDPSGIATYSQVGAKFGFGMLWTMVLSYPLMAAVQEISARIGRTTGKGLAGNMRQFFPKWVTYPVIVLLLAANIFNIGADLAAMGTALKLLIGGPASLYGVLFALVSLVFQVFIPYKQYSNYLKWLTLALFTYVATAFVVHIPWLDALKHTFIPTFPLNKDSLMAVVAVVGTTISPYLFFWQASTEVEELRAKKEDKPLRKAPEQSKQQLRRIRIDTLVGMAASNFVAFFIILTAAVTLHAHGKTDISSAAEAAEALKPVAGQFAFLLFSIGIIGTGLLALPVLAGSAAYATGEAFRWSTGLQRKPWEAKRFYGVIAVAMLLSLVIDLIGLDPIKALVLSAAINGVVAVPVLIVLMLTGGNPKVMGKHMLPRILTVLGWITVAFMTFISLAMFASFLF